MAYPTTAELAAGSTVKELTDLEPEQQDALLAEAIQAIERHCRQSFTADGTVEDPVTVTLDGDGGTQVYLPRRLAKLTDLSVSDGGLSVSDVTLSARHDRLHITPEPGASSWATRAIAEATGTVRLLFPAGAGTVEVSGVWGWPDEDYPDAVTTALRLDMEDRALASAHPLSETVRSARALGLGSIAQGALSLDLSDSEPEISTRVRRALRGLRWDIPSGALA
jgi:hypothetical protein